MKASKTQRRNSVQPQKVARRTLLRGSFAGLSVSVALPLLDIMLNNNGTALAQGAPLPVRFGIYHWACGVIHDEWVPSGTGTAWQLPRALEGLEGVRDYLTLVTGFNHNNTSPGHIPARGIALSSSHDLGRCTGDCVGVFRSQNHPEPSLDALIAEHWGGQTRFDSVEVRSTGEGPYQSNSSWKRGGSTYNRHEPEPSAVFNRLFGNGVPDREVDTGLLQATTAFEASMLDSVLEQSTDFNARLGAADKVRFQEHLEGLRAIERRIQQTQDALANGETLGVEACEIPTLQGGSSKIERGAQHSELLATALACDITRIFSYEWSANQSNARYPEVGADVEHHEESHAGGTQAMRNITKFIMDRLGDLGAALASKQEGAGTVLDNTLVFATSEHANAAAHDYNDHPMLFLGRAGGAVKAGGLHFRAQGNNRAPDLLYTAVRAVGVEIDQLGQDFEDRIGRTLVSEILT